MLKSLDGFFKRIQQDHVSAYAAQGAYFILLSFIPCLLLLVTLVRYTPITQEMILEGIFQFVPENGGILFRKFTQSLQRLFRFLLFLPCGLRERGFRRLPTV